MTRAEFDLIYTFLLNKRGGLIPFLISLPQYIIPKDPALTVNPESDGVILAGVSILPFTTVGGDPTIGDMFTINDPTDSAHTKAYIVTGVDAGEIKCSPPIAREIPNDTELVFIDPLMRVIFTGEVEEYNLNTNNLFSFSLNVEEAQA
jgi:hypothetical protein